MLSEGEMGMKLVGQESESNSRSKDETPVVVVVEDFGVVVEEEVLVGVAVEEEQDRQGGLITGFLCRAYPSQVAGKT